MMGSIIKTHFAATHGLAPNQIYSVAAMSCVANKFEAKRPEMSSRGNSDVDLVLTTRELIRLIHLYGIDVDSIEPQSPDSPFDVRSTSGKLYASAGGLTEGVLRTLHFEKTGKELSVSKISELRSLSGNKDYTQKIGKENIKVIVASGLTEIDKLMLGVQSGEIKAHFIEVMACQGGCINGGGQPISSSDKEVKARIKTIYDIDESETLRYAHRNPSIIDLYNNFLNELGPEKVKKLLHVDYLKKEE
jgi:iron only hydrogenase large subunit-like protein